MSACRNIAPTGRAGFTLVELLLALVIGTMIMGTAAGVFVTTLDTWRRGSLAYEELQTADKLAALIERHLRAAVSPAIDSQAVFEGTDYSLDEDTPGHKLTLISSAPGRFPRDLPPMDTAEIEFTYDPLVPEDGLTMRIQCPADDIPDEDGYLIYLSDRVRGLRFLYYDGTDWVESWLDDELPEAVEFTLLIARPQAGPTAIEDGPMVVRRLVWLPASQVQETTTEGGTAATGAPGESDSSQGGQSGNRSSGGNRR